MLEKRQGRNKVSYVSVTCIPAVNMVSLHVSVCGPYRS